MNEQRSLAPSCSSHWSGNGGLQSEGFLPGFVGNPWQNEEGQSKSPPSVRNMRHTWAQDLLPHMAPKRLSARREMLGGLYNDPPLVKNKSRQASCCSQTGHAVHYKSLYELPSDAFFIFMLVPILSVGSLIVPYALLFCSLFCTVSI